MTSHSKSPYVDIFQKQQEAISKQAPEVSPSRNSFKPRHSEDLRNVPAQASSDAFSSPSMKSDLSKLQRQKSAATESARYESRFEGYSGSSPSSNKNTEKEPTGVQGITSPPRRTTKKKSTVVENHGYQQPQKTPVKSNHASSASRRARRATSPVSSSLSSAETSLSINEVSITTTIPLNDEQQHARGLSNGWNSGRGNGALAVKTPQNVKKKIRTTPYSKVAMLGNRVANNFKKNVKHESIEREQQDNYDDALIEIGASRNNGRGSGRKSNFGDSSYGTSKNSIFHSTNHMELPINNAINESEHEGDGQEEGNRREEEEEEEGHDEGDDDYIEVEEESEEDVEGEEDVKNEEEEEEEEEVEEEVEESSESDSESISKNWDTAKWESFCNVLKLVKKSQKEKSYSSKEKNETRSKIMTYFDIESLKELNLRAGIAMKILLSKHNKSHKKRSTKAKHSNERMKRRKIN